MFYSVTFFILAILALENAALGEFSCGRYAHVRGRFRDCWEESDVSEFSDMLVMSNNIEGEEYLTELTALCSNQESEERVAYCVERIIEDCPTLQEIVLATVENKISFFCENGQPSNMVRQLLRHGYAFNDDCASEDNSVYETLVDCVQNASYEQNYSGFESWSVSKVLSTFQKFGTMVFECILEQARDQLANEFECGATGQDIVITFALRLSGRGYLTPTLTANVMEKIKTIIT